MQYKIWLQKDNSIYNKSTPSGHWILTKRNSVLCLFLSLIYTQHTPYIYTIFSHFVAFCSKFNTHNCVFSRTQQAGNQKQNKLLLFVSCCCSFVAPQYGVRILFDQCVKPFTSSLCIHVVFTAFSTHINTNILNIHANWVNGIVDPFVLYLFFGCCFFKCSLLFI